MSALASVYSFCADQPMVSSFSPPNMPQADNDAAISSAGIRATLRCMVMSSGEAPDYTPRQDGPAPGGASTAGAVASCEVPAGLAGLRLDQALARLFPEHSRSRLAEWLQ